MLSTCHFIPWQANVALSQPICVKKLHINAKCVKYVIWITKTDKSHACQILYAMPRICHIMPCHFMSFHVLVRSINAWCQVYTCFISFKSVCVMSITSYDAMSHVHVQNVRSCHVKYRVHVHVHYLIN